MGNAIRNEMGCVSNAPETARPRKQGIHNHCLIWGQTVGWPLRSDDVTVTVAVRTCATRLRRRVPNKMIQGPREFSEGRMSPVKVHMKNDNYGGDVHGDYDGDDSSM